MNQNTNAQGGARWGGDLLLLLLQVTMALCCKEGSPLLELGVGAEAGGAGGEGVKALGFRGNASSLTEWTFQNPVGKSDLA